MDWAIMGGLRGSRPQRNFGDGHRATAISSIACGVVLCFAIAPILDAAPSDLQKQIKKDLKFLKKTPASTESGEVWLRVARAYTQLNEWQDARDTLQTAVTALPVLDPNRASAFEQLGDLLSGDAPIKDLEQAARHYRQAIAVSPLQPASSLQKLARS